LEREAISRESKTSRPVSKYCLQADNRCATGSINMSLKVFMVPVKEEFVADGENSFSPSQRSAHDGAQSANPCQSGETS
jgi:hypothetical protein